MKKYKLKKPAVIAIYSIGILAFLGTMFVVERSFFDNSLKDDDYDYVNKTIFDDDNIPVVNTEKVIMKPFTDAEVKIVKNYYDYKADVDTQKNSLLYYESTYLQNSGVAYGKEDIFDVVAILDGTVIDVKEDNLLGKIVEIRHSNDMISVYQSLSEIVVKKDDVIKQGAVIGKSGVANIAKELNNHLHFELIIKGQIVNPEDYYNKKVDEL